MKPIGLVKSCLLLFLSLFFFPDGMHGELFLWCITDSLFSGPLVLSDYVSLPLIILIGVGAKFNTQETFVYASKVIREHILLKLTTKLSELNTDLPLSLLVTAVR